MTTPREPDRLDHVHPPEHAELDQLLRAWHEHHADSARAGRDRLISALTSTDRAMPGTALDPASSAPRRADAPSTTTVTGFNSSLRRFLMQPSFRAAACLALVAALFSLLLPTQQSAQAHEGVGGIVQVADGGRLDAFDPRGQLIGPCPLQHTDVRIVVTGPFSRTVVRQTYSNPYPTRIEAVYTFPLSHRAAVDRMTMTIGDRVIVGEVKERQLARRIYEQARESGYVASLLEQERPNIFTQSVANIEPGATVIVEIASIEMLTRVDGEYSLSFPMVVGPRYIPGRPLSAIRAQRDDGARHGDGRRDDRAGDDVPAEHPVDVIDRLRPRQGVVLLGPASISIEAAGDATTVRADTLLERLKAATALETPDATTASELVARQGAPQAPHQGATPAVNFTATYVDGAVERGTLLADGIGVVNGRWFRCPPTLEPFPEATPGQFPKPEPPIPTVFPPPPSPPNPFVQPGPVVPLLPPAGDGGDPDAGTGFAVGTDQVPDAARITPMPVRPPNRAGHDISVEVVIDSGGAMGRNRGAGNGGVRDVVSTLHAVTTRVENDATVVTLATGREIPNRDFILRWKSDADGLSEGVFTHHDAGRGGFVTVVVNPPPRVTDADVRPRELIFVLDTSGSMNGFPMEKARAVMARAIDSMRPTDTFNIITFAGHTQVLWSEPRPASDANRSEAQRFLAERRSGGGTEMMRAIDAALRQEGSSALDAVALANLPADGREVSIVVPFDSIEQDNARGGAPVLRVSDSIMIPLAMNFDLPTILQPEGVRLRLSGHWKTVGGERLFAVADAGLEERRATSAMRIVFFLTDGYVGNDQGIVQAIREHAGSTRVFAFGIGNSVNRYLLEQMALAGRGAVEVVTLADGADDAVARFTDRVRNPVLTDIAVSAQGFALDAIVPGTPSTAPGLLPDLYDAAPVIFHARVDRPADGSVTISGNAGSGRWSRTVPVTFTGAAARAGVDGFGDLGDLGDLGAAGSIGASESRRSALPVLWARSRVEQLLAPQLAALEAGNVDIAVRREVISLGERFSILTPFTSFVAVEKSRVTVGGRPMLVAVPVELPQGTRFDGFFGEGSRRGDRSRRLAEVIEKAVEEVAARSSVVVNTNNTTFKPASAVDPNFQFSDFFGENDQPKDAVVFDAPTATGAAPMAGAAVRGVPYANAAGTGGLFGRVADSAGSPPAQPGGGFGGGAGGARPDSTESLHLGVRVQRAVPGAIDAGISPGSPSFVDGTSVGRDAVLHLQPPPTTTGSAKEGEVITFSWQGPPPLPRAGAAEGRREVDRDQLVDERRREAAEPRADREPLGQPVARDELLSEVRNDEKQDSTDLGESQTSIVTSPIATITTRTDLDRDTIRALADRMIGLGTSADTADLWSRLEGDALVVRATPEAHATIKRLLAALASAATEVDTNPGIGARFMALHPIDDLATRLGLGAGIDPASDGGASVRTRLEDVARAAVEESGAMVNHRSAPASTASGSSAALADDPKLARIDVFDRVVIVAVGDAATHMALERGLNEFRAALGLPPRSALPSARLDAARTEALRRATDAASRRVRIEALHRTLAPELLAAVVELEDPEHALVDRQVFDGIETLRGDERATVSILVTTLDAAALERIRAAGVTIESAAPATRVAVGTIAATDLARLGLTEGVRRVEVVR